MKKSYLMAATAACLLSLCFVVLNAFGQGGNLRPSGMGQGSTATNIALLDVSYIFKNHPRFKSMMEEMKSDVERAETAVNGERDKLRKLVEQLDTLRKGTQDYKNMEEEIARREAELSVKVSMQRKEFLTSEAKIYNTVYQEIEQEVGYYCSSRGIDIVLRFNGDPVDVNKPDSVLSYINKPVVFYSKSLDITPNILDAMVKRSGAPAGNNRMGARPSNPFQK